MCCLHSKLFEFVVVREHVHGMHRNVDLRIREWICRDAGVLTNNAMNSSTRPRVIDVSHVASANGWCAFRVKFKFDDVTLLTSAPHL